MDINKDKRRQSEAGRQAGIRPEWEKTHWEMREDIDNPRRIDVTLARSELRFFEITFLPGRIVERASSVVRDVSKI